MQSKELKMEETPDSMQILFPHEKIRKSQDEFIEKIKKVLEKKENLIAHCPTGTGKTAAVLSVALPFALKNNLKVFFITPRHTQHRIAVDTLKLIKEKHNIEFTAVDLIGKKLMCAQPGVQDMTQAEFYDFCTNAVKKGECIYYQNLKKEDKITHETREVLNVLNSSIMHVEEAKEISKNRVLCPFEISMLVAKRAAIIIADYHHILVKSIRESILGRSKKELSECIIIIDESHNLPARCRELLSNQLSTITIDRAEKEAFKLGYAEIAGTIEELKNKIEKLALKKIDRETKESLIKKDELKKEIEEIIKVDQLADDLLFIGSKSTEQKKRSYAIPLANFLLGWEGPDNGFVRIIKNEKTKKGYSHTLVKYSCLDPSFITSPIGSAAYSTICMSGTLKPLEMYKDLFGFKTSAEEYPNPFPESNRLNIIVPETTTKFTARSPEMYKKIAEYCARITNEIPGNSAVFFPSYYIRNEVYSYLSKLSEKTIFLEAQDTTKQQKAELLEKFKSYKNSGAVLLGVSSGNFGEGIDIQDNILKCVIVAGIPLEKPDLETKQLINYYEEKFGKGWDYGYIMPAIIRCLQNAGRCIRSEDDKGIMIFLDQRFVWDSYFRCFPQDSNIKITKDPIERIREFFNKK